MPHYPINHPLSGLYRGISVLISLVLLGWAALVVASTAGQPMFSEDGAKMLGLHGNRALAFLVGLSGLVVLAGAVLGRRRQHFLVEGAGVFLILLGLLGLTLPPLLAVSAASCVAVFIAGALLLLAGMYTKQGTAAQARAEEMYRHHSYGRVAEVAKVISSPATKQDVIEESRVTDRRF